MITKAGMASSARVGGMPYATMNTGSNNPATKKSIAPASVAATGMTSRGK